MSRLTSVPSALEPFRVFPSELIHVGMYFVLGAALGFGRGTTGFSVPHVVAIAIGSAYGAIDEWHQSFVPGRTPAVIDWVADTIGVVAGYLLLTFLLARRNAGRKAAGVREPEHTDRR